uniref:Iron-sulfur cluster formation ABC transporter ATP-binding subunit n=1 Tax=Caulacanthus ustulatus TaxID=31411 RepID=UPI0027DA29C2|nr:Iron-sulfur cluster formation ABC transporter ATP-binding subunit [Caulacanthus ustulatus]WCH57312.1 Iron-sulfur cluster formation ABC transporter ATP-binding subunit [Caulacanthus ustulatus]
MKTNLLKIQNLYANIDDTEIIKGLNLSIKSGEIHAIMGKNGSGKSTLAKIIAGHPNYNITQGSMQFNNHNLNEMSPEERSLAGIFLAFQYPVEIPGVSNSDFLRLSYNSKQKALNKPELDPLAFFELINEKITKIGIDSSFLTRNLNEGFSGGEKKKNEILQMLLLDSQLCILDEIDSGLDIDALKVISKNINSLITYKKSIIIITHYQRILDYIVPNYIHIMKEGKIIHTGDSTIAKKLEQYGYDSIPVT